MTKDSTNDNDYAVARELHHRANEFLMAVARLNEAYNYDDPYSGRPKLHNHIRPLFPV